MSESFDTFNAPQFVDFCNRASAEEEIDHEKIQITSTCIKYEEVEEFYTPTANNTPAAVKTNEVQIINISDESCEETEFVPNQRLRRSLSVGNLDLKSHYDELCREVQQVALKNKPQGNHCRVGSAPKSAISKKVETKPLNRANSGPLRNGNKSITKTNATHNSTTFNHTGNLRKAPSVEHINKLAQPKYRSNENVSRQQQTLAELVREYQNKTPVRFHSQPKINLEFAPFHGKLTVPQSPALLTKKRLRPVAHYPTHEEREQAEFEEAQRFKIKAHPIKKHLLGPIKAVQPIEKKPLTIPEPFNLTKPHKAPPRKEEVFEFHAQPIPKSVLEPPKLKEFPKQITKAETPTFMRRLAKEMKKTQQDDKENKEKKDPKPLPIATIPEPFSFEARDKELQKKKEMFIQKVLEEEKKAREFHARPMPKTSFQSPSKEHSHLEYRRGSGSSGCSSKHAKSDENISAATQFRARPPTVLYKEPFVPKKEERPLLNITSFCLNTEQRAKEREEYEKYLKEKEEKVHMLRQRQEEEEKRLEEEERARLRKAAEVKAQPIRKYKEVHIQPAYKVTEPITPVFHTDKRINRYHDSLE